MIRLDIYQVGSGYRLRAHDHRAGADQQCNEDCEDRAQRRCYGDRNSTPKELRGLLVVAALSVLSEHSWGHASFLDDTVTAPRLL
jgi:hypothetical protein